MSSIAAERLPSPCVRVYSQCPPPTFVLVLSEAVADSMLTTLQKAPKNRLGLAVSFPISLRPARSWTQLMANNYKGNFSMTAPGGLITWEAGAAAERDASLLLHLLLFQFVID